MQNAIKKPYKSIFKNQNPLKRMLGCWQLYALLAPALIYLLIFHYQPMWGLQIAFRDYWPSLGVTGSTWVGFKHLLRFVTSSQFSIIVKNTLILNFFTLIAEFPLPVILALLLNECGNNRYKKLVQNATYIPNFISTVVVVGTLINFLSPSIGIINKFVVTLGGEAQDYMAKPEWFRPLYVLSGIWQRTGWASIIYIAALSSIDPTFYEAAQIDGASRLQRIWYINVPGIMPTVITLFILRCGQIMNVGFEKVYLMQNALNLSASEVISTYVYKAGLLGGQFSYSSAVGLFNSIINFTLIVTVNALSKRVSETSLW